MAWRYALCFAAGLAAALAGVWLLSPPQSPPLATAEPPPSVPPTAVPATGADTAAENAAAPASLADILRIPGDFAQTVALYQLASRRNAAGIEQLLDEAGSLDQASERAATSILYARYADLDPAAALRHIQERGDGAERWLGTVFHAWARRDLDAALRHAETLTAHQRTIAGAAILRARDDLPQESWLDFATPLTPQGAISGAVVQLATDAGIAADPTQAWEQALAQKAGQARLGALHQAAFAWAATDPHAALEAIVAADEVPRRMRETLRGSVVSQWASSDPAAALAWATALPASRSRTQLLGAAAYVWAQNDPRAAVAWAATQGNDELLQWVAPAYATHHPEEAIDWIATLPSNKAAEAMGVVFSTLSYNDPEATVRLLDGITDANARRAATHALAQAWGNLDPDAAMEWVDRLPDAELRATLYPFLLRQMNQYDAAGAMRHLDRITDPQARDSTVLDMLDTALHMHEDVSLAEALYDLLAAEDFRREGAERLYNHLAESDPARAARYR